MPTPVNFVFGPRYSPDECLLIPTIGIERMRPEGTVIWVQWLWYGFYFGMVDDETLKNFGD